MISFNKTAYSKQLIYTKNLLGSLFIKNNLFETTYLCKIAYYDLIFKNSLFQTAYLCKIAYYHLIFKNSLLK